MAQQLTVAALSRTRETLLLALHGEHRDNDKTETKEPLQTRLLRLCSYYDEVRDPKLLDGSFHGGRLRMSGLATGSVWDDIARGHASSAA